MKYLLIFILSISPCFGEKTSEQQAALEKMFSALTPEQLPLALGEARKVGIHEQVILEAHFLNLVDQENFHAIAKLAPDLLKYRDIFTPDTSEIFAVKEDWLSIVEYAQALAALEKNDTSNFKKHITEAFWLSPRQGQAFAPHINKLRLNQAMAKITLASNLKLIPQSGETTTTLGKISKGKKGTLFYFWSPMSEEVYQDLQNFITLSQLCQKNEIAVVAVLVGYNDDILTDAKLWAKEDAAEATCTWIKDPKTGALSNLLRIMNIPASVLVSPEGKILFNGSSSKANFWKQLQTLAPKIKRPQPAKPQQKLPNDPVPGCNHDH